LHIYLPQPPHEFVDRSVQYAKNHADEDPNEWMSRFGSSIDRAVAMNIVSPSGGVDPYVACNREMLRRAMDLSENQKDKILALAMMENGSEIKQGGAADFAHEIEAAGITVHRMWPHRPHRLFR
jgi:hypothetical protein